MTPEQQRIAIAEACKFDLWVIFKQGYYYRPGAHGYTSSILEAWKLPRSEAQKYKMYADRKDVADCEKVTIEKAPTPDYLNDLNAMHDAEKVLTDEQWMEYESEICNIALRDDPSVIVRHLAATASQRAEAFLRTLGKWNK